MTVAPQLNWRTREQLRRAHRPQNLRLLFIGEAPPASGRFFYRRDSGLYRAMLEVFQKAHPSINDETFLAEFRASGCYLVDLCTEPVDRLEAGPRRAACRAAEPDLAKTLSQLRPEMIATLVRSIEANVRNAVESAEWNGKLIHLPYPGRWSHLKENFVKALFPVVRSLTLKFASENADHSFCR